MYGTIWGKFTAEGKRKTQQNGAFLRMGCLPPFESERGKSKSETYSEEIFLSGFLIMKTLLKNKRTGTYFKGLSDWTGNLKEAFDFKLPDRAVRFVKDAGLKAVDVVLAFEDPRYNINVPVDERFGLRFDSSGGRVESRA